MIADDTGFSGFMQQAFELWGNGGWGMYPLALNALLLCSKAIEVRLSLVGKGYMKNNWGFIGKIKGPGKQGDRETERAALIAAEYLNEFGVVLSDTRTEAEVAGAFEEIRAREIPQIDRDLRFIKYAMAAAPLWGLLGTVSGMLATFDGLASGGGGDNTMDMVASGISEALITTQTGLMVAIPGYFFHYYLSRHRNRYQEFLSHLQTAYTQHLFNTGQLASESGELSEHQWRKEEFA